ncbi:MAG: RecX family transcriptional regulator [candidate division WOR-3 bacterium]|nr:MAG: RecX family transcriptional regulator [candidate division WOR-3 bacterium]
MKISKIEPQKKNKNRSSIFVDGKFAFGLSNEVLVKFDLHEGDDLDDETVQNVLLESEKQMIRNRAFRLLRYRSRSTQELKTRLLRIGFDDELVAGVIEELMQNNSLDDEKFARSFVADYTKLRPRGNVYIRRELTKRGIAGEVIEHLITNRDEKVVIEGLVQKKLSDLNIKKPKDRARAIRRLLTRGFTPSVVYEVIREHEKC